MSLAMVRARAALGIDAPSVDVEVHLGGGLPSFSIVGLPNTALREARDRVRGALTTSGFEFPRRRITVNLSPADLPKDGARFDLAIALGILAASGQLKPASLQGGVFSAELALSGALRPVPGTLPVAVQCTQASEWLVVAADNGEEAALGGARVYAAAHLLDVCAHLRASPSLVPVTAPSTGAQRPNSPDLAEVRGQHRARRALEIAAAGGHSLLFCGPPGSGKSMLAARLPGLLPPMTNHEALESAAIHSVAKGRIDATAWGQRPFRQPHHTASSRALTGGGRPPRPGEISLAHHGVLFLDELPEFPRDALEALREPLETGEIHVARVGTQLRFPARFQLVAAMNPCPCGYLGEQHTDCRCTPNQVRQYQNRISGPLLDRFDMQVDVPRLPPTELEACAPGECTATVAARVATTRRHQQDAYGKAAAGLVGDELERHSALDPQGQSVLRHATEHFALSARAWHRCRRLARTIADLEGSDTIRERHIAEALGYRKTVG
ncbi:competence protein ComM [Spiribacter salinus M19-40]|uniref:Competence protein ComM n=2 Tax=Spiribacter salinus TaxID=1335746 RepID=R4VI98_9GAMM|nr:YifB family Mg chelatase-like AAA ATPase [Spiribacter salinus]AGM40337.1 competence protein ComM [Spiribacter salinus M19-40]TQE99790.1 MAG: YifB family Mg chelatase-like AAA ATPase [Spiribacter salinus]